MTIWTYWEQGLDNAPPWIRLGRATIERHRGDHDVVTLDATSISRYLGEIPDQLARVTSIATRVDYLRVRLLERYGGIWLDLDIAAFPALGRLTDLLDYHELVSTGLHPNDITLAFLAARPHGEIVGRWVELQERALRDKPEELTEWGVLGSALVAPVVAEVGYHEVDRARVYQLWWREWPRFLSYVADERPIIGDDPFVVCFFNHQMGGRMAGVSSDQLVNGPRMISRIYRSSLGLGPIRSDRALRSLHALDDCRWWLYPRVRPRVRRVRAALGIPPTHQ